MVQIILGFRLEKQLGTVRKPHYLIGVSPDKLKKMYNIFRENVKLFRVTRYIPIFVLKNLKIVNIIVPDCAI